MAQLPTAQSQASRSSFTPSEPRKGKTTGQELLTLAAGLAPIASRLIDKSKQEQIQTRKDQDEVALGELNNNINTLEIQELEFQGLEANVSQAALDVARDNQDGVIDDNERKALEFYNSSLSSLQAAKAQRPNNAQSLEIRIRKLNQEFGATHPRLSNRAQTIYRAHTGGGGTPSVSSGAQAQSALKEKRQMELLYGSNPTDKQRVDFAQVKIDKAVASEMIASNDREAKLGTLKFGSIDRAYSQKANVNMALVMTKWDTALQVAGGHLTADQITGAHSALTKIVNNYRAGLNLGVNKAIAGGSQIDTQAVNKRVAAFEAHILVQKNMIADKSMAKALKTANQLQKDYYAINGGNISALYKTIAKSVDGNDGALTMLSAIISGKDGGGAYTAMKSEGWEAISEKMEENAISLVNALESEESNNKLVRLMPKSVVLFGLLATSTGKVTEEVKGNFLEGIAELGRTGSLVDATKALSNPAMMRQILDSPQASSKTKTEVSNMDVQVQDKIASEALNVRYSKETDQFFVFDIAKRLGQRTPGKGRDTRITFKVQGKLTTELNSLYGLRKTKYSSFLGSSKAYRDLLLGLYGTDLIENAPLTVGNTGTGKLTGQMNRRR